MTPKEKAVEWLVEELERHHVKIDIKNTVAFEQAKAIEKEQITEAYHAGLFDGSMDVVKDRMYKKYYNETYTK